MRPLKSSGKRREKCMATYVTVDQFAEDSGHSIAQLRKFIVDHGMPAYDSPVEGEGKVVDADEAEEWIEAFESESEDDDSDDSDEEDEEDAEE
jgi:hypothetical protein